MAYFGVPMLPLRFLLASLFFLSSQCPKLAAESPNFGHKSPPSSSKALSLARTAQSELNKSASNGVPQAISILKELTEDHSFRRLHTGDKIKIYTMLLDAYGRSANYEEQQALLAQLLKDKAFKSHWISLRANLGASYLAQEQLPSASKVLKALLRTPKRRLSTQEATTVASLHTKIEQYTERKLKLAQTLYDQKAYAKAAPLYQHLLDAAYDHGFPQSFSKQDFNRFLDTLSLRLASCYYLSANYEQALKILSNHNSNNPSSCILRGLTEKKLQRYAAAVISFEKAPSTNDGALLEACICAYKAPDIQYEKTLTLCDRFLQTHPESPFFFEALLQKAIMLWQMNNHQDALKAFSELDSTFPNSKQRDKVLFYTGLTLNSLGLDSHAQFLEVCTNFPKSSYAAESYYRLFSEEQYESGDVQAIGHLKKMANSYAHTPYGILAAFFIAATDREACPQKGLSEAQTKTLYEIIEALDEAIYDGIQIAPSMPPKMRSAFYTHIAKAEYEKIQCHFTLANFKEVLSGCDTIKKTISHVAPGQKAHLLWQNASFLKSRTLLLQGNERQAREELTNLLDYATHSNYEKSEPVVLALLELASAHARAGDQEKAFTLLNKAQALQIDEKNGELLLEILIAKSQLHHKMGELDKAMMLLSSVINEESASSLRIQAMFLRAEVYERKGRRDLAFRQLQTCAKKGGEWGLQAEKKLEENYGYE